MSIRTNQFFDKLFERPFDETQFAHSESPENHWLHKPLQNFIEDHDLADKKCLEVGTGYGQFQHLVSDYVGIDVAFSASKYMSAPFINASATTLPFQSASFDCVWSNHVMEHVAEPVPMLEEMWRVLKPGGYLFLTVSWQCGPWLAEGYPVRPFSDFDLKGKLIKASVPIRKSLFFRSIKIFPQRLVRLLAYAARRRPTRLRYRSLKANYEHRWMPDSTAETSVEPFEVYIWYRSRGAQSLNYPSWLSGYFIRRGHLAFQKPVANSNPEV